jgi:hypothetical protein
MDSVMYDEISRLGAAPVNGELESNVRREIIDWILSTVTPLSHLDMKDVITMFWKEKLN